MFGWFGRKSAPEVMTCAYAPPPWLMGVSEEGFARGYEAQMSEVYRTNPVGLRAVRLVAGAIGGLTVEAGQPEAAKLAKLVLESVAANLLLHGNAYVHLLADSHGSPRELALLRPERVSIASDARGHAAAYVYRAGGSAVRIAAKDALHRRQVAHIKALNPADDHLGLGCLDAAIAPASIHNRASRWNKALLDNAARPSGALSYEPSDGSNLSAEQFDRLKAELAEQFAGATNAGRPLLLDGGLKWQAMALTPAEMDFVALKESAARDIALAFGVPPVLVGLPGDATYANAREAGRALYRQTVLPMAERILAELSTLLSDWMGEVTLTVDSDQISELAEDRAKLWEQIRGADFLSAEEKRSMLGFEP
jgi:HK97 family phage portal protein